MKNIDCTLYTKQRKRYVKQKVDESVANTRDKYANFEKVLYVGASALDRITEEDERNCLYTNVDMNIDVGYDSTMP